MTQQSGRIWVMGGRPLNGTAAIPAAKNSVLPLIAAALLCRGPVRLRAVPRLSDVECSLGLLRGAGCAAHWQGADIVVAGMPSNSTLPGETAAQMRASILFCAPLLARLGRAETSLPGGCNIGARPIDLHLEGLARMGAKELDAGAGKLVLAAPGGLHGTDFTLRFPSVGATETLLLAAACARGTTVLRGAAREPEISDLADFLNRCGGRIEGAGTSTFIHPCFLLPSLFSSLMSLQFFPMPTASAMTITPRKTGSAMSFRTVLMSLLMDCAPAGRTAASRTDKV